MTYSLSSNRSLPLAGQSISATGSHWCRGWKAYRADNTPEGTVPGRVILVTLWEGIA